MRQREISHLVRAEPKGLSTAAVGTVGGVAASFAALVAVRAVRSTAGLYRVMRAVPAAAARGRRVPHAHRGDGGRAGGAADPGPAAGADDERGGREPADLPRRPAPASPLRSGSPASHETWQSLGAPGRKIVSSGASAEQIAAATGESAQEPIRVYAGKSGSRTLEDTVEAVIAELDRTGAWDREVLVLFTGTGTGWLQEWSLSAIEFLTGGNCATASLQYSVYTSALSYLVDRRSPRRAGNLLLHAVRRRMRALPPGSRPRLFVAGESLGSFGGQAAFRDLQEMLASVDGAVWTGTPSFTPLWRELVSRSREGAPAIAPILDDGRNIRVVTREADLHRNYHGGLYAEWKSPRVVYAQHPSDPVVWWQPALLWDEPRWLRERVGHDVTPAMRWFPWITFWQIAADMPLSITARGGHGHSYHEEMVPIWAAVLGQDAGGALTLVQRRRHQAITEAIRRVHPAAEGRCGSLLHCDQEPGRAAPRGSRPVRRASRSWVAVTPEPQYTTVSQSGSTPAARKGSRSTSGAAKRRAASRTPA